jgi:transcriptional regulator with XRE-family HTH domain
MTRRRRPELHVEAQRRNREQTARLGAAIRRSRRSRRMTQRQLGERVGLVQSTISLVERGLGGTLSLDAWQRIGLALDRPLRLELAADTLAEPVDDAHLRMQELVLRIGRRSGYATTFELATRPADPSRSTDVGLRNDRRRWLVLAECWNTFGDVGAAARSSARKQAEAEALAIALGEGRPHRVATVWVVRATARNRAIVARYPEVFASRFPGSSAAWVRALTSGGPPPDEPGLVWCDIAATRLFAWRRRGGRG